MPQGFGGRQVGVQVPVDQKVEPEFGAPNKVIDVIPLDNVAVRYTDGTGRVHREVWMLGKDGTAYKHPDAEQWSGQLRTIKGVLLEQLVNKVKTVAAPDADIPEEDAVDVVSAEVAEEAPAEGPKQEVQV